MMNESTENAIKSIPILLTLLIVIVAFIAVKDIEIERKEVDEPYIRADKERCTSLAKILEEKNYEYTDEKGCMIDGIDY